MKNDYTTAESLKDTIRGVKEDLDNILVSNSRSHVLHLLEEVRAGLKDIEHTREVKSLKKSEVSTTQTR